MLIPRRISPDSFQVKHGVRNKQQLANIGGKRRYFVFFGLGFFAASRSVLRRRAARFLILSLPRLCPINREITVV